MKSKSHRHLGMKKHPRAHSSAPNRPDMWMECAMRGLTTDPLTMSALQQLSVNPTDQDCEQLVLESIRTFDVRELLDPQPFRLTNPVGGADIDGPVRLGRILETDAVWGIHPEALTEHMVVVGRTGGGKSSLIKAIIKQLLLRRSE